MINKLFEKISAVSNISKGAYVSYLIFVSIGIVLFFSMYSNIQPEKLHITINSKAQHDILSPITIEDREATIEKQQEALSKVEDQYTLKVEYAQNRVTLVDNLFQEISRVTQMTEQEKQGETMEGSQELSLEEKLSELEKGISKDIYEQLTAKTFEPLLLASTNELDTARNTTITAVRQIMKEKIRVGDEEEKKLQVAHEINSVNLSSAVRDAMINIAQYAIIPNYVYDVKATEIERQKVLDELTPVTIKTGQVLATEGQMIDRETYRLIKLAGLLDEEKTPLANVGLAFFVTLVTILLAHFLHSMETPIRGKNTYVLIFFIIFSVTLLIMKILSLLQPMYSGIEYIVPVAMATMLIKMLIDERVAIITSFVLAICGSVIFNNEVLSAFNYMSATYIFSSAIAGALFLSKKNHRTRILTVGVLVSILNIIVLLTLVLLTNGQYSLFELGFDLLFAFLSGFISAVLVLGLMPFFEAAFGMLSTMKLIELSNPNHPLLRKILTEAPGTYHHSIMVANLSEAACEAIGADGFLARVGSYYHDLGKTKRPHFYIENQMNIENPHDKIAPQLSKTIITAHPSDGAKLLRKYKLPKEIVDIAEQHHGTTLLKYFYHKAKENDPNVVESEFRYPGPKPKTKEIAIVSIADSVEAAVRSMKNPNPHKIESLVRNIITDRLQDGQFDECDITIKELDLAAVSMCETLKGIFHTRIEYPEIVKKKVKQA